MLVLDSVSRLQPASAINLGLDIRGTLILRHRVFGLRHLPFNVGPI